MTTIRIKRLISTAPYENVEIELMDDVPREELSNIRKADTIFIDDWEKFARTHYMKRPEKRNIRNGAYKPKPTMDNPMKATMPRADPETVKYIISLKNASQIGVLNYLNAKAKQEGLPDATFFSIGYCEKLLKERK